MTKRILESMLVAFLAFPSAPLLAQTQTQTTAISASAAAKSAAAGPAYRRDSRGASGATDGPAKSAPDDNPSHKLGSLVVNVDWRFRTEVWDWFQPSSGQNAYAFEHSLLRIGLGQKSENLEWFFEGAQDAILGLPDQAIVPGVQGQLGLGGTYYAANGGGQNNANAFVRQAFIGFKVPVLGKLRLGRFGFLDGAEVIPVDRTLATIVNTRIKQRLIGDFGFSAVGRSFDGAELSVNAGKNNFTLLAARPTRGVFQIDANGELDADLFYGSFTVPVVLRNADGELRIFALGYVDERGNVLKTDNRPLASRAADQYHIRIGTYGADYVYVFRTHDHGIFDFLVWGALQNGSWGLQTQRSEAFVGEFGWQPQLGAISVLHPWLRAGYSYGSGDSNPTDGVHGTFFQVLPTPRAYARFPFYNMMNNEDFFGSAMFRLRHSIAIQSELHALRLANSQDLWYLGGGAFQPHTFGYVGRPSGGSRSLANVWDLSMNVPLGHGFDVTTYYAHAWGKSVIKGIYPLGASAQFGYVETNFHF
jgi:Alginate export